jgi:hypothetical protein
MELTTQQLTIEEIKEKMKAYRDFYGGDFLDVSEIEKATSKKELAAIIERHKSHMEDMLSDAISHLDDFKQRVELMYPWD